MSEPGQGCKRAESRGFFVLGQVCSSLPIEQNHNAPYLKQMMQISNLIKKAIQLLPFTGDPKPLVTVVDLTGVIGAAGLGRRALSLAKLEKAIEAAFKPDDVSAVALAINSPGGSPVQSRLIYSKIRRLAAEAETPVLAFIEDVGASGGYILALAGDEIYADESSIVGSIGVISSGFGFHEAIGRFGVERRVYTAGENKSSLDPFKPEDKEDVGRLQRVLDELHEQFVDLVKSRRGKLLGEEGDFASKETFSGEIWTAKGAQERGLIDGIAQLDAFLRERFGKDVRIKRISADGGSLLKRMLSGGDASLKASLVEPEAFLEAGEARALWARYGR